MSKDIQKNQLINNFDIESFIAICGGYVSLIYGLCSVIGHERAASIGGTVSIFYGMIPQIMDRIINFKIEKAEIQARRKN